MQQSKLKNILEAVLLAADRTLTVIQLESLFELDEERPTRDEIRKALHEMADDYETRGYELKQVASGFRLQVRQEFATWVGRLWEERPAKYTRALLETMALIAYRQPITRGEIEEVRGVSVSSNIIKTLMERNWIKVLGHKDVPGKPTLYGSTKEFLDYFNLKSLDQLPTLAEIKDLDSIHPELELDEDVTEGDAVDGATESSSESVSEPASGEVSEQAVEEGNNTSNNTTIAAANDMSLNDEAEHAIATEESSETELSKTETSENQMADNETADNETMAITAEEDAFAEQDEGKDDEVKSAFNV